MNVSFQDQKDQKSIDEQKRTMPFREYWHLYLALGATGILTAFAGVYLGLAPSANGNIVFLDAWDGIRRIFFAFYYACSFLLVAEGATLFSKDKLLKRDVEVKDGMLQDVPAQRNSMTAMLYISVGAIVATTVAAGTMLASWLGALDQFVTIPAAAQEWIVLGPPALLVFDVVCALIYQQNSKQSELDRWVEQQKRLAEADAQEAYAQEFVRQYKDVAPAAARRAANTAAMTAARKWAGGAMTSEPVTPPVMAEKPVIGESEPDSVIPLHMRKATVDLDAFLRKEPGTVMAEPETTAMTEAGYPKPVMADRGNGHHDHPVAMTAPIVPEEAESDLDPT